MCATAIAIATVTTTTTMNNARSNMEQSATAAAASAANLGLQQYSQWREWALRERRHSVGDLMSEFVDPAQERHMYLPMKQPPAVVQQQRLQQERPRRKSHNDIDEHMDDDAMVARVVAFFQSVQNNHAIRQMQLADEEQEEHYNYYTADALVARTPLHRQEKYHHRHRHSASEALDDSFSSSTDAATAAAVAASLADSHRSHSHRQSAISRTNHDDDDDDENLSLTELGQSASFLAQQAAIWDRIHHQQQPEELQRDDNKDQKQAAKDKTSSDAPLLGPVIPEWLHHAARQEGRRIRVVAVNRDMETRTVTCVGCQKQMLAACHVQIVYCPVCGSTFSPEILVS